ncbi:amino acid adenylation domain-containing protein [Streptomyces sp. ME18-1-4]|uniref:non-ribosomal peptide synthetase n=1 Tax=Streptomyces sp. ME18-1-4 TaxID=3028685 RepID=UPI0029B36EC7|nr:amino acid adenylation domain-containing protein [Streptomyces sp. ME18-1-4]MDX3240512.1 amino acid adenylation domain-containing protein [Streptomyces sp. ME18-1-4]
MTTDLFAELYRRGVRLRLADGRLHVSAPPDALTPELREEMKLRRDELIEIISRSGSTDEPAGLVPRPEERHDPFPLTDIQHAYWVGRTPAVELGGNSTHCYLEFDAMDLDVPRLGQSLDQVVRRHDMLRAIIQPDGRQRVLPEVAPYDIRVTDLSGLDDAARESGIARIREELAHQVLPADRCPLFEVRATRLDDRRWRLHLSLDMLVMDGFSFGIFQRDWFRFYSRPDSPPEPIDVTFRDYVLAEQRQQSEQLFEADKKYWLDRLDRLPPAPELPLAVQPGQLSRPKFARRDGRLSRDQWSAVKETARRRGLTPSAVLITAYADVLRRWSKRPEFTLNLTLFNRRPLHPRIGEVIGDFTSLIPLETRPEPEDSFTARAKRLHHQLMEDLGHSAYSGVRVMRERARRLGGRLGAAMPVVFTSMIGFDSATDLAGTAQVFGDVVYGVSQTPQVWLDYQVLEDRGELLVNWDFVDELFPAGMIEEMFLAHRACLERLGESEAAWDERELVTLPAAQADERRRANATEAPLPERTLCGLVEEQAERTPEATAVISADGEHTYRELVDDAYRLAHVLQSMDATRDTLVGVITEKGYEQVAAALGVTRSGAAYLPIQPRWPAARRTQLLQQGRVQVVVTTPQLRDELTWPDGIRLVTLADAAVRSAPPTPPPAGPAPDDLAYVIFTSGSTGTPKGVMIDHRAAANTVQDLNDRYRVTPDDRVLALSALSFDLSVYDVFGLPAAGGAVVMPEPSRSQEPRHWSELVDRHRVTIWNTVPALMQAWIDAHDPAAPPPGHGLRLVMMSGDWIQVALPDRIRACYPEAEVMSLGGATEASIWSIHYPIGAVPPHWSRIPYGKPLANQTMHVYDQWLEPSPVWTTGEIYIGGSGVARGYWADPERTAERFVVHPRTKARLYRTGDLGRYLPGGDIEFLGREDSQIKLNGYRIELGEIAAPLLRHPGVRDALVSVDTNPRTGRRQLVAYLVPAADEAVTGPTHPDADALRAELEQVLPEYMVPRHYLVIPRVPLSANGKVDVSALPAPRDHQAPGRPSVPQDELERTLLRVWQEVLERDDFGTEENFFELGGDSLHAIGVLERIGKEFGTSESQDDGLRRLFDHPTVAGLAAVIRAEGQGS